MKKFFPIKTETACQLKWNWSSIYLHEGSTNSCHRVSKTILSADEFDNFHNIPKKISDRELMLKGEWPSGGCEYCKKIEDAGGVSDRLFHLNIPDMNPKELDEAIVTHVTPKVVEVYFDNVCNMSCIYCSNLYSSKIHQENVKFGRYEQDGLVIDNTHKRHPQFKELTAKFWDWMEVHYADINRLQVLGGEPFYQSEFDNCIDFLYNHTNRNLEFNVVSNLMVSHDKFKEHILKIKELVAKRKIKRFDLTASIDCWGPQQEYIRHGMDIERWKQNFEFLLSEKWITLNINQVISVLSLTTVAELLKYINQKRETRAIGHYLITVALPSYLNPDILGANFFDTEFTEILSLMPELTWQQREIKQYMLGVQAQINNSQRNTAELNKLRLYLDEIDRRRNVNWRTTFPWIVKELDNVV